MTTRLGFQDDGALFGPQRDALLDAMRKGGGHDLRLNVIWGKVRKNGGYDFSGLDQVVNAARQRGLHPQFTIFGTPRYMPNADQTLSWQNNNPTVMQNFARDVATHFHGRVGRYSIGNEPNWDSFLQGSRDNPAAAGRTYRQLYRAGRAGIKGVDPAAQVLLGEVTSSPNAAAFLRGVLSGKPLRAEGFAYHPYDQPGKPNPEAWDIDNLGALQHTLAQYQRSGQLQTTTGHAVPLYLTEFGAPTQTGTPAQRASRVARAFSLAQEAGARELVQYQVAPSAPGASWDTSLSPTLLASAIRRRRAAARAAQAQ